MNNNIENNKSFEEKHPIIYSSLIIFFCIVLLIGIIILLVWAVDKLFPVFKMLTKLDAVIIVALIAGTITFLSNLFFRNLDHRFERSKYLTEKREKPYEDFMEMIYKMSNHNEQNNYSSSEIGKDIESFSKQISLWGSKKVVNKWNQLCVLVAQSDSNETDSSDTNMIVLLESIMNEMRKDLGVKKVNEGFLITIIKNINNNGD